MGRLPAIPELASAAAHNITLQNVDNLEDFVFLSTTKAATSGKNL